MKRIPSLCVALFMGSVAACGDKSSAPPPLPPPPPPPVAQPAAPPEPAAVSLAEKRIKEANAPVHEAHDKPVRANGHKARETSPAKAPKQAVTGPAVEAKRPAPAQPAPVASSPPEKPRGKVNVPSTDHVRVQLPAGLQGDLDKDPRMQPWANQVVSVIDRCYTQTGSTPGVIEVRITMHDSARPDAALGAVPNGLAPVVACATGGLLRTKMPLFTGAEGTRYTVRVQFQ